MKAEELKEKLYPFKQPAPRGEYEDNYDDYPMHQGSDYSY